MVYSDSDAFTVDLGQDNLTGVLGEMTLDETISLTSYDATPFSNQQVIVHSSTYSVTLDGLGSVVVVNLGGSEATISGDVGFNNWAISGAGSAGASSDQISNAGYLLDGGSGGLFNDGAGKTSVSHTLSDSGVAPTDGSTVDFDFDGTYRVDVNATALSGLWFASGTARGDASIQTVYERFELVTIPEPSVLLLVLSGAALVLRRQRN